MAPGPARRRPRPIVPSSPPLPGGPGAQALIGASSHYCSPLSPTAESRGRLPQKTLPLLLSRQTFPPPRDRGLGRPLWRRWLSLKDRDLAPADKVARVTPCKAASHAFGSRYFECPPSAGWGRKWSPGLPGAHCPDRQPWLGASACLRAWMASLPSQRGTDERCHAAPWRRGWTRACSQTGLVRATEAKALSRSRTPRPRAPAGREVCAGPVERRPAPVACRRG